MIAGASPYMGGRLPRCAGKEGASARAYTAVVDKRSYTAVYGSMMIDLNDPTNWDTPLFPVTVAAQAARIAPGTMRMWFERKRVFLTEYDQASTPEQPLRLLTLRSVLALAVAADLSRGPGGDVSLALKQAKHWTYVQHRAQLDGKEYVADPAGLFPGEGVLTVLVHYGDEQTNVVPVSFLPKAGGDGSEGVRGLALDMLFPMRHPVRAMPRLLALNWIDKYVRGVCEGYLRPEIAQ